MMMTINKRLIKSLVWCRYGSIDIVRLVGRLARLFNDDRTWPQVCVCVEPVSPGFLLPLLPFVLVSPANEKIN